MFLWFSYVFSYGLPFGNLPWLLNMAIEIESVLIKNGNVPFWKPLPDGKPSISHSFPFVFPMFYESMSFPMVVVPPGRRACGLRITRIARIARIARARGHGVTSRRKSVFEAAKLWGKQRKPWENKGKPWENYPTI